MCHLNCKFKDLLFTVALVLCLPLTAWGQVQDFPRWRLTKGGSEILLVGDYHGTKILPQRIPAKTMVELSNADAVVVELADKDAETKHHMLNRKGNKLSEILGADLFADVWFAVPAYFRSLVDKKSAQEFFDELRPIFAFNLIVASFHQRNFGFSNRLNESVFNVPNLVIYLNKTKPYWGLDTLSIRDELGEQCDQPERIRSLFRAALSEGKSRELYDALHSPLFNERYQTRHNELESAYAAGEVFETVKYLNECINHPRNKLWLEKLPSQIAGKNKVILVAGLAHMYGQNGLVQGLINQGYKLDEGSLGYGVKQP